jgi:hypothetical protein
MNKEIEIYCNTPPKIFINVYMCYVSKTFYSEYDLQMDTNICVSKAHQLIKDNLYRESWTESTVCTAWDSHGYYAFFVANKLNAYRGTCVHLSVHISWTDFNDIWVLVVTMVTIKEAKLI